MLRTRAQRTITLQGIQPVLKVNSGSHRIRFRLKCDELSSGDVVDFKTTISIQHLGLWCLNLFNSNIKVQNDETIEFRGQVQRHG